MLTVAPEIRVDGVLYHWYIYTPVPPEAVAVNVPGLVLYGIGELPPLKPAVKFPYTIIVDVGVVTDPHEPLVTKQ